MRWRRDRSAGRGPTLWTGRPGTYKAVAIGRAGSRRGCTDWRCSSISMSRSEVTIIEGQPVGQRAEIISSTRSCSMALPGLIGGFQFFDVLHVGLAPVRVSLARLVQV